MSEKHIADVSKKDTISRQAAIEIVRVRCARIPTMAIRAMQEIKDLPSILPEQRWIPCDETVDVPDHEVLACDKFGEEMLGYLEFADEQWICESEGCVMYDPIAWMEKPEPYKRGTR